MPEQPLNPNPSATPAANAAASPQPSSAGAAEAPRTITLDDVKTAFETAFAKREQLLISSAEAFGSEVKTEAVSVWDWIRDQARASHLLIFFVIAMFFVAQMNEAKVGLTLWGIARVPLFAWMGYRIDRAIFGRLKGLDGITLGTAWKRRAVIVAATLIAGAMLP